MLTFSTYIDTIPLSATNATGGTRVIGVGCRYYTTLRRGVFICEYSARNAEYERTYGGYIIYTIFAIYTISVGLCQPMQIGGDL